MRLQILSSLMLCLGFCIFAQTASSKVTDAEIQESIQKARRYLTSVMSVSKQGDTFTAYALLKTGSKPSESKIANVLEEVEGFFLEDGRYTGAEDHYYTAGVVAMLYDTIDGEKYQHRLQAVADYIIEGQHLNGAWYYPSSIEAKVGDTSISQYALLGLWAAERNGIEIPPEVWENSARWFLATQHPSGGFVYHPNMNGGGGPAERARDNSVRPSLIAAGGSSLVLCYRMLYPNAPVMGSLQQRSVKKQLKPPKTYGGLLEIIDLTGEVIPEKDPLDGSINPTSLTRSYQKSLKLLGSAPKLGLEVDQWLHYYMYGLERFAAFAESDRIVNRDWYQEGAEYLLNTQNANGSWKGEHGGQITTSFSLLFLYRATQKTIRPRNPPEPEIGSGLLAGGRGLPSDLRTVQKKNGRIVSETANVPVADLLSQLESTATADLVPLQEAVIESVHKGQRAELVGQTARLLNLLKSPDPAVRQIAIWALARGNDLTLAPTLIDLIRNDPHFDVAREAYSGLCVLSRQLDGVGLSKNPIRDFRNEQGDSETGLETKARQWRAEAAKRWEAWYLTVRPYRERDDLKDLQK